MAFEITGWTILNGVICSLIVTVLVIVAKFLFKQKLTECYRNFSFKTVLAKMTDFLKFLTMLRFKPCKFLYKLPDVFYMLVLLIVFCVVSLFLICFVVLTLYEILFLVLGISKN